MIIPNFIINVPNDYWGPVNVKINTDESFIMPQGLFHEFIPRPSESTIKHFSHELYCYELSFDGYVPESPQNIISDLIIGVLSGTKKEKDNETLVNDARHYMAIYKFIDMYVFPEKAEVISYVTEYKKSIIKCINEVNGNLYRMCELLTYGGFHIIVDPDKIDNKKYDESARDLNRLLELKDSNYDDDRLSPDLTAAALRVCRNNFDYPQYPGRGNNVRRAVSSHLATKERYRYLVEHDIDPFYAYQFGPECMCYLTTFEIPNYVISIVEKRTLYNDLSLEMFMCLFANHQLARENIAVYDVTCVVHVYQFWTYKTFEELYDLGRGETARTLRKYTGYIKGVYDYEKMRNDHYHKIIYTE